ncbi:hypothetical protein [Paludisphaera mucosa]|uniref:Uncharacterized protein n=1 Tax=Paludisphaera mucosa TaxID=3030827 RepID=A0ABT6FK67_9BACT|nr:hypothetical protein [Paludisphaera mucosa]MDG3007972.1 hypothetical protein [Paludisphaera mucosa]
MADVDEADEDEMDRLLDEFLRPGRGRLGRRADGGWFVDAADLAGFLKLPAPAKLVMMVLLLCLKDRATEVHFHPTISGDDEPGYRMWYVVDGASHELVPPPREVGPAIAAELRRLAGLHAWRARLAGRLRAAADRLDGRPPGPASGRFHIATAAWSLEVAATFHPSRAGDGIVLAFGPSEVDPAPEAQEQLRLMMGARPRLFGDSPEDPA